MIEKIIEILKGIDKDDCEEDFGWWETSDGAKFGAEKLNEINRLFKKPVSTDKNILRPDKIVVREVIKAATNWWANEAFNKDFNDLTRTQQKLVKDKFKLMSIYSSFLHSL